VTLDPADVPESIVESIPVTAFEIIQVANDPSALEFGRITFEIQGGRR
jgi:hypothetical protein